MWTVVMNNESLIQIIFSYKLEYYHVCEHWTVSQTKKTFVCDSGHYKN